MLDVPRSSESNAADFPGKHAADAVVSRLPSQSGSGVAAARSGIQHGLERASGSGRSGRTVCERKKYTFDDRADQLLDGSSFMDGMSDDDKKHEVVYSCDSSANPEEADNYPPTAEER